MIDIKDNFIDPLLIKHLKDVLLYQTAHFYGHGSSENGETSVFYQQNLNENDLIISYLHKKINKEINLPTEMLRVYFNIQHTGMEGGWHNDDGDMTALLMVTDDIEDGSGNFEYRINGEITKVSFKQNRLILFSKHLEHRGAAPKNNRARITLAFKLKFIKN